MMNEEIVEKMDAIAANPELAVQHVEGVDPNGAPLTRDEMEAMLATKNTSSVPTDIFTQEIELPSQGYFGGPKKVRIRRMTIREEEILYLADDNPTYLDDLALSCIVAPKNISLKVLHPNDLLYILYAIRNISFDSTYKQNSICPSCKEPHIEVVDITKLPIKFLDAKYIDLLKEVQLPVSGDVVTLKIMTEGELLELDERIKYEIRYNKITDVSKAKLYEFQTRRESVIEKLNGEPFKSIQEKRDYINKMTSKDYNKIINASNVIRNSFGLDRDLEVKCPHCKRPYQSEAAIVPEFFRPSDGE